MYIVYNVPTCIVHAMHLHVDSIFSLHNILVHVQYIFNLLLHVHVYVYNTIYIVHVIFHSSLSTNTEEHFTFTLTNLEGQFRFGFCRYPAKGDICMCFLRYVHERLISDVLVNCCYESGFLISSDLPWFKVFYRIMDKISDMQLNFQVRIATCVYIHVCNHFMSCTLHVHVQYIINILFYY